MARRNTKGPKVSMVEKTKVKLDPVEGSLGRKVVGMGFALVGFLLILAVIILNIISNVEPRLDESLNVPVLDEIVAFTNKDKVTISGTVEDSEQVILYVNDTMIREVVTVDEDGRFSYEYNVSEEGEYVFQAVSVVGFPMRRGSEKSESVQIVVDWTAPSADVTLEYEEEVDTGLVTITGEIEPDTYIRLLGEEDIVFETESDEEGMFVLENVRLVQGENEFRVELEDRAGNKNVLARRVTVLSAVDAPPIDDLPEASGDLANAFRVLLNNRLMSIFGILALVALLASSGVVALKIRKQD
jgi:hypothetical protein